MRKVDVDRSLVHQLSKQKMEAGNIKRFISEQLHWNNNLTTYCSHISDNCITENNRSKEELEQKQDACQNNCHFFLTALAEN